MNHLEKLEAVRQEIIRVVPEILKVEFGCLGKEENANRMWIKTHQGWQGVKHTSDWSAIPPEIIIGRDITLADVLRTMNKKEAPDKVYGIMTNGTFFWSYADSDSELQFSGERWDLSKTLEFQDEPTISFLHEILV